MITQQIEPFRHEHGVGHVERLCQAAGLSRATYYRLRERLDGSGKALTAVLPAPEQDVELRGRLAK